MGVSCCKLLRVVAVSCAADSLSQVTLGGNRSVNVRKMACHNGLLFGRDKAADREAAQAQAAQVRGSVLVQVRVNGE